MSGANWSGEAASSYQDLTGLVIGHFRQAATSASAAADALRRYGSRLAQFQREGVAAVNQVVHWMTILNTDRQKLQKAQADVKTAQTALADAQSAASAPIAAQGPPPMASSRSSTRRSRTIRRARRTRPTRMAIPGPAASTRLTSVGPSARRVRPARRRRG